MGHKLEDVQPAVGQHAGHHLGFRQRQSRGGVGSARRGRGAGLLERPPARSALAGRTPVRRALTLHELLDRRLAHAAGLLPRVHRRIASGGNIPGAPSALT